MHWKSRTWILISVLLAAFSAARAQIVTTQVTDTIYLADGSPATGTVLISWPAFTTSNGDSIPTGSTSATIAASGALSVQLIPNAGATPIGTYYTVIYHLGDGSTSRQYWVVPASTAPVKISAIESTVLPASVAMQTVSKSYVDTAIAAAVAGQPLDSSPYVLKAGDSMTGPLNLPADPVSAAQAADKNYVDESVAALTSGLGQMVSTLPSATQTVAQPTGTQLGVNRLNGEEYASQYVTGNGNNGIANAVTSPDCAGGCDVIAEQNYGSAERYSAASFNNQTHIEDERGGRRVDSYLNPLDIVNHGLSTAQAIDDQSTQSEASIAQQLQTQIPGSIGLAISQEGLAGGSNLFPEQIETPPYFKMGYSALSVNGTYNTQGQHVLVPEETHCYGVGDCLMGSHYLYASGGFRDSADEGAHPFDLQTHEDTQVFTGACASGCTPGSTSVVIASTAAGGTQGDGRFLIDTNPSGTITSASTGGALVGGSVGVPHASAQFSGTSFPVSVFLSAGQAIPSQSGNMAPGTVTFSIATAGVPSGYATNTGAIGTHSGLACVADQAAGYAPDNYEMAPFTVVDATHLQMTLNKPHQLLASIAIGGLCGYGLEQTADTANGIRQLFPVVGSTSATGLYYAGGSTPVVGQMNQTSAFLNVGAAIASATRSGNVVTVTTAGNLPADVNGLAVTIAGVADPSYNGSYVVTTTGINSFTYAQTGANSSSSGGSVSVLTGGFALYPMAEVLSVFDPAARSVDGQMTLAPNSVAWAANDPVEQPHFYQELVAADTEYVGQSVPRPTTTLRAGLQYQQNNGPGLIGWSIANASPTSNYLGYGGTHGYPDAAYEATGIWHRTMNLAAGEEAAFAVHCNLHGCGNWNSGYNLFELDSSAGTDLVTYSPAASSLSIGLRGSAPYTFTPQAFTAGTINVGTLNATTINAPGLSSGGVQLAGDLGGTNAAPRVTGLEGNPIDSTAPTPGKSLVWSGSKYMLTAVPTLDANGRVVPGSGPYGGVLGNDTSPYGLGPAIFENGYQVASFFQEGNGQTALLDLGYWGSGAYGAEIDMKGGGNCEWGSLSFDSGDGALMKDAGGCNNPMASLMLGVNGAPIMDFEPDYHPKMHTGSGSNSYATQVSFTGGAGAANCGAGAVFDPGSNDGAGRIVVGSSPPGVCRVTWQHAYAQVAGGSAGGGGWANSAPVCSVWNEGHRATGTIVFTANPSPGDTIAIEGQTWRFWPTMVNPNDVVIGATAAATASTFFTYYLDAGDAPTPGNAPGVDPPISHYMLAMPTSTSIALTNIYMDGVTGNSAALSTSDPAAISVPATLSGGTLPPAGRTVVASSGIGGMAVSAVGGSLSQGDVLAYSCIAYW